MMLVRFNISIYRCSIIEYLNFHACISSVTCERSSYTDTIVCSRSKHKFKPENKISILFLSIQITTGSITRLNINSLIFYYI